ncbi:MULTISPECIES: acyl-CoA dehydrogenase FadE [unclassified Colwellia]|uniref:acyl-CoA dehydrogenase FadE n=1 Tax=unclassified Colwellia TaxID=196834 RepID=UPI0015F3D626|nr:MULTISPECIES: acyl-CoA dehydrogenase FadE [unclassified Colwellia]MBA6356342.1 acyl-CoA dehydrogenase [Colwellia sp. BRX8-3]MBA6359217.1 acyl-CoA dehydrogenase [Colwellia sp. BRX8-6]MBA6368132.1 acyl-CoA dehydrogenase [Colwellia sp. BRX8-5]MBA6376868.1 acyl-CoA dehydrogenase [Colwellia sp. BRX8-2]MBA6383335.1 acyl-CoA dehydrogenase [Colwellia sp. BRX10-9]
MEQFTWFIYAVILTGFMAYTRAALSTFTLSFAALMAVGTIFDALSFFSWIIFAIIALPLNISDFRKQYITHPLLKMFRSIMPQMSRTEQEAIDAGTTWFEAELFRGNPDWKKLHNYETPRLSVEEQSFLNGPVEEVCKMTNDWQTTHVDADLSPEVWQFLKDNKFFAMIIKKKYGGLEFCAYAQSRVLQKLSGVSAVLASTVGVPNSLGPGELLQLYGTKEQQDHYLPRLAVGDEIPCFALTSPEAGSDAGAIPDEGIICHGEFEGKEVLGMRLTWDKRYITLAPIATVLGLAFKLKDPDHLLGETVDLGITCALIPTDLDGVITGRRHFPLNVPFQNGPTQGNGVFVPLDYIIGGAEMAGQGWRMLMECLSVGRAITLPSNSAGGIKSLALATGAYSRIRRQFKIPIGKMEGIEEPLARIGGNAYLMDAVTTMSTGAIDLGEKPSVISAIIKYHLTEKMRVCVNDAMDIHGGKGICMGEGNYLARAYQGAPIAITVEGANILTRSLIIYGQGAIRCHPYVLAELAAANQTDDVIALKEFDHALFGHIGFAISNVVRSLWFSLTGARILKAPFRDETSRYYQLLTRFSSNLAMLSDISMLTLGGDLKRKERISARLGDVLSHLYLSSATLKRFNDEGRQQDDLPLVQWALEDSLYETQQAIDALISNFPNKIVALFLRAMIFPVGKWLKKPSDITDHKVAQILQTPGKARERLGQGQYLSRDPENVLGQLEQTLDDIIACEPIFKKVCQAIGEDLPFYALDEVAKKGLAVNVINAVEAELLCKAELGRKVAINVDDFDSDELRAQSASH